MPLRPRQFAGLAMSVGLLSLIGNIQTLFAQQYCVSGAITSIVSCNGCGFKVGDPVALTFTVQPGSSSCTVNSAAGECTATAVFSAQSNGLYWYGSATQFPPPLMTFLAMTPPGPYPSSTSVSLVGSGTLSPALSPPVANSYLTTTISLSFSGNLLSSGHLPTTLPASATTSTATLTFAPAVNAAQSGSASFSYTGQTCAQTPAALLTPSITPSGIVPLYSSTTTIQPGEWVSIYGTNLAADTISWNGNFPTSLGGTTVTINGKSAYLWFVSSGQINLQAPDDFTTGSVPVVVTTSGGSSTSSVTLAQFAPAFSLFDSKHPAGLILRTDGSGAYGNGTYDILGPTGTSLGFATVAAKAGDVIELFGVGFGPTNPTVAAGAVFAGSAPTAHPVSVTINNIAVTPSYAGMVEAGLYQLDLTIPPNAGKGDVPLQAIVGGVATQSFVVISLQ